LRAIILICLLVISVAGQSAHFLDAAAKRANTTKEKFASKICGYTTDQIAGRVFLEYGSIFVAADSVKVPNACIFRDEEAVREFQEDLRFSSARIGVAEVTLQTEAMRALLDAIEEASTLGLRITPLDGTIAGTRSYNDTARLWSSRFDRALTYWEQRGRIAKADADSARGFSPYEQVPLVLKWEQAQIWFSTGFDKSIFNSVAAPGTSQHISGLAFDVVEHSDNRVRSILNKKGWFQTIRTDQPHFTYLGLDEKDLPGRGLEMVVYRGNYYWVPKAAGPLSVGKIDR